MTTKSNEYGDATLEELAERHATLETLIAGKNWPDGDMDRLVEVSSNLFETIVSAPCDNASAVRAKARFLIDWIADNAEHSLIREDLIGMAADLRRYRASERAA